MSDEGKGLGAHPRADMPEPSEVEALRARVAELEGALLHHETGERITRKDLNNAFRQGQENGRYFAMLFDGGPDFLTGARPILADAHKSNQEPTP